MTFRASNGSVLVCHASGDGPPILCLHGLGGGAYFFDDFAPRLSNRYRIYAADLPGTGRSAAPESVFSMEGWVEVFAEFLQEFSNPVVLLGHSMSAILGLKLAHACPDRIASLILVGGLPEVRPFIRERLSKRFESVAKNGMTGLGPVASPGVFSAKTIKEQPEVVALFERHLETQPAESYLRGIQILLGASATDLLPLIRTRTLVVSGSDDQYAPPECVAEFARQLPGLERQVVLPECGHMPFLEAPEAFANAVEDFLSQSSG